MIRLAIFTLILSSAAYGSAFNQFELTRQHEINSLLSNETMDEMDFRLRLLESNNYYLGFDCFFGEDDDIGVFTGRMSTLPLPPSPILSFSFEM